MDPLTRWLEEAGCIVDLASSTDYTFTLRGSLSELREGLLKASGTLPDFLEEQSLTEVILAFQSWHDEAPKQFSRALQPLLVAYPGGTFAEVGESLLKVLLSLECIQNPLALAVLEMVPTLALEDPTPSSSPASASGTPLCAQLLKQLTWLDHSVITEEFVTKFFEVCDSVSLEWQKEMIQQLPNILHSGNIPGIIGRLESLLDGDPILVLPLLNALADMRPDTHTMDRIHERSLNQLGSIDTEDIPELIRFLLRSYQSSTLKETLQAIRTHVNLLTIASVQQEDSSKITPLRKVISTFQSLLFSNPSIPLAWLTILGELRSQDPIYEMDVFVLLLLYSLQKKRVEKLIIDLGRQRHLSGDLMHRTISILAPHFSSNVSTILRLVDALIGPESKITSPTTDIVSAAYTSVFKHFDVYQQQEAIASLLSLIGSGSPGQSIVAIHCLSRVAEVDEDRLRRFIPLLKGVLEYADTLPHAAVTSLFDLFAQLAVHEEGGEDGMYADLCILIRKDLTHPEERYWALGIRACIALIGRLGAAERLEGVNQPGASRSKTGSSNVPSISPSKDGQDQRRQEDGVEEENGPPTRTHPVLGRSIELLEMLFSITDKNQVQQSLAWNVLGELCQRKTIPLAKGVLWWIYEKVIVRFSDEFLLEVSEYNRAIHPVAVPFDTSAQSIPPSFSSSSPQPFSQGALPLGTSTQDAPEAVISFQVPAGLNGGGSFSQHEDEESDPEAAVIIYLPEGFKKVAISGEEGTESCKPIIRPFLLLSPLFRLLCHSSESLGRMGEIEGVLGCGVGLPGEVRDQDMSQIQEERRGLVILSLITAIHWFHTLIETFSPSEDTLPTNTILGDHHRHIQSLCSHRLYHAYKADQMMEQAMISGSFDGFYLTSLAFPGPEVKGKAQGQWNVDECRVVATKPFSWSTFAFLLSTPVIFQEVNGEGEFHSDPPPLPPPRKKGKGRVEETGQTSFPGASGTPNMKLPALGYLLEQLRRKIRHILPSISPFSSKASHSAGDDPLSWNILRSITVALSEQLQRLNAFLEAPDPTHILDTLGTAGSQEELEADREEMLLHTSKAISVVFDIFRDMFQVCYTRTPERPVDRSRGRPFEPGSDDLKQREESSQEERNEEWDIKILIRDMASGFSAIPGGDRGEGGSGEDAGLRRLVIFLAGCKDRMKGAKESLSLLRLLKVVSQEAYDVDDMQVAVHAVAEEFLERPKDPQNTLTANELQELLLLHLRSAASPLTCLSIYVDEHLKAFEAGDADSLDKSPLLVKETLPIYLKALFTILCEEVMYLGKDVDEGSWGRKEAESLDAIEKYVSLLTTLTISIRQEASKELLLMAMRQGRKFVDAFVRQALPRLERAFLVRKDKVIGILKKLQGATRVLHIVCSHSKVTKDTTLAKPAPALKKSMESLLLHVKELLRRNHSGAAFWMGNLKHRDLAGREVSSQIALESSEEEEEEEEEEEGEGEDKQLVEEDGESEEEEKDEETMERSISRVKGRVIEMGEGENGGGDAIRFSEIQRGGDHKFKKEEMGECTPSPISRGSIRQVARKSVGKRAWRGKDARERAMGPLKRQKSFGHQYLTDAADEDGDGSESHEDGGDGDVLNLFGENLGWNGGGH